MPRKSPQPCAEPGCSGTSRARRYCAAHYRVHKRLRHFDRQGPIPALLETDMKPLQRAAPGTGERLSYKRGVLLSKLPQREWEAAVAACRLFGKDPRDLMAELVSGWLAGVRERMKLAEVRV